MAVLRQDKYTQRTVQKEIFSDFLMDFDLNPDTNDLYRNVNLASIQNSLKALMLTNRGERLFQPDVGSSIREQLFELFETSTVELLKQFIKNTIEVYEPRVKYEDVVIVPSDDQNGLFITIYFSTIQRPGVVETLTVFLTRVR